MGPRDAPVRFGVPFDYISGKEITPFHMARIDKLHEALEALHNAMHEAEGSAPPEGPNAEHRYGSRRMAIANTHLETALLFARAAVMETG